MGSPPLTRGTQKRSERMTLYLRITPAYAGNTFLLRIQFRSSKDHPRLRGEHKEYFSGKQREEGSPPLTRGTPGVPGKCRSQPRITPAYAGNTSPSCRPHGRLWDHPRLRGEHAVLVIFLFPFTGSPPLTRGTRHLRRFCLRTVGITPAYAGNTRRKAMW